MAFFICHICVNYAVFVVLATTVIPAGTLIAVASFLMLLWLCHESKMTSNIMWAKNINY
jgi:hypothetical protein